MLSTQILPSIISTSRLEIESPSPVPPYFRVVELSAWLNGWNKRAVCSGVMPIPLSRTENFRFTLSEIVSASATVTTISPCSVNFTALLTRLIRI